MEEGLFPQTEQSAVEEQKAVDRAFGAENRNRLIDRYFDQLPSPDVVPADAWRHVYRLLL